MGGGGKEAVLAFYLRENGISGLCFCLFTCLFEPLTICSASFSEDPGACGSTDSFHLWGWVGVSPALEKPHQPILSLLYSPAEP